LKPLRPTAPYPRELEKAVLDAQKHLENCADWTGRYGLYERAPRGVENLRFDFIDLGPVAEEHAHLTLRFGAQLFCIHLLLPEEIPTPGSLEGLGQMARLFGATPCVMLRGGHDDRVLGIPNKWSLLHLETGAAVDPPSMLEDDPGPLTDGELQHYAANYVFWRVIRAGLRPAVQNSVAGPHPTLWYFDAQRRLRWLYVQTVREPHPHATRPEDWEERTRQLANARMRYLYPSRHWDFQFRPFLKQMAKRGFEGDFVSIRFFHPDPQPPGEPPRPLRRTEFLDYELQGNWFDDYPPLPPATPAVPRSQPQVEKGTS
jgi:hypothetical protein